MTIPPRKKRPTPERDGPLRSLSTLFASPVGRKPPASDPQPDSERNTDVGRAVTDSVGLGYRVIDEYIRQGQQAAKGFNPSGFDSRAAAPDDASQMSQRLMQYGWDFAGLWFETWSKMTANGAMPASPFAARDDDRPPPGNAGGTAAARPAPASAVTPPAAASGVRDRVIVSVSCDRPTTTALEVRPGAGAALVVHALRAEGHEAPPIRDITMNCQDDGTLGVRIAIDPDQPSGVYNAMILDQATNLPRGTLSVVIKSGEA